MLWLKSNFTYYINALFLVYYLLHLIQQILQMCKIINRHIWSLCQTAVTMTCHQLNSMSANQLVHLIHYVTLHHVTKATQCKKPVGLKSFTSRNSNINIGSTETSLLQTDDGGPEFMKVAEKESDRVWYND